MNEPYTAEEVLKGLFTAFPDQPSQEQLRPRASMLASCSRQNAYYVGGVPTSNPGHERGLDTKFTQEQGRLAEDLTVSAIETLGTVRVVNRQIELDDNSIVSGHPDGELEFFNGKEWVNRDSEGHVWGWEHKHFGRFGYKEIAEKGLWSSHPDIIVQAALYGLARKWDAVSIVITSQDASSMKFELRKMRSKVNPKMMVFNIDLRNDVYPLMEGPLKNRAAALQQVINGTIKPEEIEREFSGSQTFPCNYCDFQDRCKIDGQGTIQLPPLPLRRI